MPSTRWVLASLSLAMLLSSLGTSIANVGLPTLAHAFGATFQQVQWVVIAYLLSVTSFVVGIGRLGDTLGRRRLLLAGLALFTTASALCGLAPRLGGLIAARAMQGLGAAAMLTLALALVRESVPKSETGRAMGLLGTMSAIGTALGPSLGGVLIAGFGWRALFLVNLPLGVLAFLLARRHLPAERSASTTTRAAFDPAGTVLLAMTLAAYALAMTTGRGHFGPFNVGLLVVAALGFGLFVRTEARAASPLIQFALFRDPVLSAGLAMSALVSTVMMATLVVGPFYLSAAVGLDAAGAGMAMSVGPLAAAVAGVPAGRLVDRFAAPRITVAGLAAMVAGTCALAALPTALGTMGYVGPIVLVTIGYALFQAANNTAVLADVHPDRRGVVSGMLGLSRNLGLVTGASAMGALFAMASNTSIIQSARADDVAIGMRVTFAVTTGLIVVALAVHAMGRERSRRPPSGLDAWEAARDRA